MESQNLATRRSSVPGLGEAPRSSGSQSRLVPPQWHIQMRAQSRPACWNRAKAEGKSLNEVAVEALADGLGLGESDVVRRMTRCFLERDAVALIAFEEVPREEVSYYGVAAPVAHHHAGQVHGEETAWETALEASLFYDTASFLKIRGRQNQFRISYTGISTRNPEGVRYHYRMKGLNDTWSEKTFSQPAPFRASSCRSSRLSPSRATPARSASW